MKFSTFPSLVLKMDPQILLKKFKGCLLGALTGDCLGAPFEGETITAGTKLVLHDYFDKIYGPYFEIPRKNYTDDTAMTIATVQSLIDCNGLNPKDLAVKYVQSFYKEPSRGYGESVPVVFAKLRTQNFSNLYEPASAQFNGSGSFGNGGAMRIAPIALFFQANYKTMIDAARTATKLTHANKSGIDGATLQCIAIQQSLHLHSDNKLDVTKFCNELIEKITAIEKENEFHFDEEDTYIQQLEKMLRLLQNSSGTSDQAVIDTLGNSVSALFSVPTAIYCFLRATEPIDGIKTNNPIRRSIEYAVSLGGDTDTIASMCGAIAGAYYGDDHFDSSVRKHCEYSDEMEKTAEKLFTLIS